MADVTVIIPCYRQAHWLGHALRSVAAASAQVAVEVVVVDDGSPDNVPGVVADFPGVVLIRQENAGLSAARNAGILAASGQYLVFLDSDDSLRPLMLARGVEAFEAHSSIDVVHGLAEVVHGDDPTVQNIFGGRALGDDAFHALLSGNCGPPNTFMVRRSALSRSGVFDTTLRSCEDWDLWLSLAKAGSRFILEPRMRSVYRRTPGSMSQNLERMWESAGRVLRKHDHAHGRCRECQDAVRLARQRLATDLWPNTRDGLRSQDGSVDTVMVLARHPGLTLRQIRRKLLGSYDRWAATPTPEWSVPLDHS